MHVGLFSPVWPPGDTANGIVTYVRIVRDELRRRGHRVTIFSARCEPSDADGVVPVVEDRWSAVWRALRRRLGSGPDALYGFGRAIADTVERRHAIDPLDVFEMEESFGWCGAVARRLRLPVVVKLHGPAFLSLIDGGDETTERRERIRREGDALRSLPAVISPSRSTLAATAARYALHAGILTSIANPVSRVDESLVWRSDSAESGHILFVGRFDFRKGGDAVLAVFARIASERSDARLSFVGPDAGLRLPSGELRHFDDYVRSNFSPDIVRRIAFLGNRPMAEIARLRTRAAVTVAATRWESFGYVIAEAMNQGCPVVAFDVAGVNELIEHEQSGLLAPLGDVEGMARLVGRMLDDRALAAALGRRAREAVVERCGAEQVAAQLLALYRRLIDTGPSRRVSCR